MADSEWDFDWDAIRRAALNCLDATWSLGCFAEWSKDSDYDVNRAAAHLDAIDRACDIFKHAMLTFGPARVPIAERDSHQSSAVFDALVLAAVGEGPRPDFQYGPVCCATAHEAAFELLRWALLRVEDGLNDELEDKGLPDNCVAGIGDLHQLSPEELKDTLVRLERRESLRFLVRGRETRQIGAWVEREWAALTGHRVEKAPSTLEAAQQLGYPEDDSGSEEIDDSRWMRFIDAENITGINRGVISKAASKGEILQNGKPLRDRRIDRGSFTRWAEKRASKSEQQESDAAVQRKLGEAE